MPTSVEFCRSQMTTDQDPHVLATVLAEHFAPPFRYERWQYVSEGSPPKLVRDENGFPLVEYYPRPGYDGEKSPAVISFKSSDEEVETRPLTFLQIATAVLEHYQIQEK